MAIKDNNWTIELSNFSAGYSPLAFSDSLTEKGGSGHASAMKNCYVIEDYLTQGSALSNLTGTLTESIQYIMDKAVSDDVSYAIGTSKLFQISSTTISAIHTITSCTEGESIQVLKGYLYYFYNTASEGRIGKYDLASSFTDSSATGLQVAPHPSDKKEDIMVFGNGRYAGVYLANSDTLDVEKLDFGDDVEVADVIYNAGYWYIAVNSGVSGTNRNEGQIYLYDGSALSNLLEDESGVGMFRIGFLYRINGIVYVAYQDLSSTGFIIGYLNNKAIMPLVRYTGDLPTFAQKTLFKNTILFLSGGSAYSAGAIVGELPFQLSQIFDGGYSTATAISAPFGTPIVASTEGSSYRIAKTSGYDVNCTWNSIVFPLSNGKYKGMIDDIIVITKTLGEDASCSLTILGDQATLTSTAKTITGTDKRRHYFNTIGLVPLEDMQVALDWAGGSASNACAIRRIIINGHWVESI